MFDLQVLAWQADITRVTTLLLAKELSNAVYSEERRPGCVPHPVAPLEHPREPGSVRRAQPLPHRPADVSARQAAGDAGWRRHLLDHSMILYGSAMGDGNQHNHYPLPIILAGGASGS